MPSKIYIIYPSGAHGNFLKVLLNAMSGFSVGNIDRFVYDNIKVDKDAPFGGGHFKDQIQVSSPVLINIQVRPESYLKYATVCLNRTSGLNILLEDLNVDTFNKLSQHPIYNPFRKSLAVIFGQNAGNVSTKFLREWARLCLFDSHGTTITQWISPSKIDDPSFVVDFECFYDGSLYKTCKEILVFFKMECVNIEIMDLIEQFNNNNKYREIDHRANEIIEAIQRRENIQIRNTNFMIEAWVDQFLVDEYGIDPLLQDEYFTNTNDLIESYKLK